MKHLLVALSFLVLCTQQITFTMECNVIELQTIYKKDHIKKTPKSTIKTFSHDEAVFLLDTKINEKCLPNLLELFVPSQTNEERFLKVINTIAQYACQPSYNFIKKLCAKNDLCKAAIEYFFNLARKNIDNVTIHTLSIVQDPTQLQPIAILNQLPAFIKEGVMSDAYHAIDHSYDIDLTGHTGPILYFDISTKTHHAATCGRDKTLRLWDLKNGKIISVIPENEYINSLKFNSDGSHLATVIIYTNKTSEIRIWDTQSSQLLRSIKLTTVTDKIHYTDNNFLMAFDKSFLTVIATDIMKTFTSTHLPFNITKYKDTHVHWNTIYTTENPGGKLGQVLTIKKTNCPLLYLGEKAIEKIQPLSSDNIENTPLFQQCTDYEKDILRTKQYKKTAPLLKTTVNSVRQQSLPNTLLINT